MNVCIVGGAGYVGFITGLGLSQIGHRVINVDVDKERVRRLQSGECLIYEKGLQDLLKDSLEREQISFTSDLMAGVESSDIVFIAVGTPSAEDGTPDMSQVTGVVEEIAGYLDSYKVLVIKSTVPMGVVSELRMLLNAVKVEGKDFDLVSNPEFLREGKGIRDFMHPDRIVIGADASRPVKILRKLYGPIIHGSTSSCGNGAGCSGEIPVIETSMASAQIIKYASNAFLATRISFINEVASLCERVGADIADVVQGVGHDPRIGHEYLAPGIGFGGPCLEKDLRALIQVSEGSGHQPRIFRSVLERNDLQAAEVIAKVKALIGEPLAGKTVAVFGLTFKAGTNDVRNSPALRAVAALKSEGVFVRAHDPVATPEAGYDGQSVSCFEDPYETVEQADALMILTEWPEFQGLDYRRIKEKMSSPCLVDGRNLLDAEYLRGLGFHYAGVGRP